MCFQANCLKRENHNFNNSEGYNKLLFHDLSIQHGDTWIKLVSSCSPLLIYLLSKFHLPVVSERELSATPCLPCSLLSAFLFAVLTNRVSCQPELNFLHMHVIINCKLEKNKQFNFQNIRIETLYFLLNKFPNKIIYGREEQTNKMHKLILD